jgi:hypothetical protein
MPTSPWIAGSLYVAPVGVITSLPGIQKTHPMRLRRLGTSQRAPRCKAYCSANVLRIVRLTVSASPLAEAR